MRRMRAAVRYGWALPLSLVGAALAVPAVLARARVRRVAGALEVYGGGAAWLLRAAPIRGGAQALTLGHVILGRSAETLDRVRAHEQVHVRQAERWGVFFLPAYLAGSLWARARGRHYYYDNPFEREAYAREGAPRRGSAA